MWPEDWCNKKEVMQIFASICGFCFVLVKVANSIFALLANTFFALNEQNDSDVNF